MRWLQGIPRMSTHADSVAGWNSVATSSSGTAWSISSHRAQFPDAGAMHWDGERLVETGVHADYVEHWVRDDGPTSPCWAVVFNPPTTVPPAVARRRAVRLGRRDGGHPRRVGGDRVGALALHPFRR